MANVDFKRKEYTENVDRWRLVDDCYLGEQTIKKAREKYLPFYGTDPKSILSQNPENGRETLTRIQAAEAHRYSNYLLRARFYNFVKRTVDGLKGLGFQNGVSYESTDNMAYMLNNSDGKGVGLEQSAKNSTENVLKHARAGLLVDYPATTGSVTVAQQQALGLRANIVRYDARQVINWGYRVIGADVRLALVVLEETTEKRGDDGFEIESVKQYRVLMLDDDGLYIMRIYDENGENYTETEPRDGTGARWSEIPFTFIGAQDNDADVDSSPVYDIATINVGHYQNSADYENSVWLIGQPIPWISGLTQVWADKYFANGVTIGSGSTIPLPENGAFGIEQAQPNSLAMEAMEHKQEVLKALGAQMLTPKATGNTSATEASIDNAASTSILVDVMQNVQKAYDIALNWAARFNNVAEDDVEFKVLFDPQAMTMTVESARLMVEAWQTGLIAKEDARAALRKTRYLTREDEDIDADLETNPDNFDLNSGGGE